jgi:maltose O-acetyltransferase
MMSSLRPLTVEKTEKEKMLAGELYNAFDPELLAERQAAKQLCFQFNQLSPVQQSDERKQILQQLLRVDHAWIESPFHVDYGLHLHVGKNFYANHGCTILDCNQITIGTNCLLAPHVCISAATHPLESERRAQGEEFTAPITIGDNVWIGANATICPGVTLGNGVVVGAGAVVTKSFPDNVVVGGVPAKILKTLPESNNNERTKG